MKQLKQRVAFALVLVMLLVPALTMAVDEPIAPLTVMEGGVDGGVDEPPPTSASITMGEQNVTIYYDRYKLGDAAEVTYSGTFNIVGPTGEDTTVTGTITIDTTGGNVVSVNIKDVNFVNNNTAPTLSVKGDQAARVEFNNVTIGAGDSGAPAMIQVGDGATATLVSSGNGTEVDGAAFAALQIDANSKVVVNGSVLTLKSSNSEGTITGSGTLQVASMVVAENTAVDEPVAPVGENITIIGEKIESGGTDGGRTVIIVASNGGNATPTMNITLSSNPNDIAAYVPLGNGDGDNITINGIHIDPDVDWKTNKVKITNGDLLVAGLLTQDPSLYPHIGPTARRDNVTIRKGAAYEGRNPRAGARGVSWYGLLQKTKLSVSRDSTTQAMNLLQGRTYSLNMGDQPLINIGIGNVWQAPVPDKDYDPLSQYVPPEVPPRQEADEPIPED